MVTGQAGYKGLIIALSLVLAGCTAGRHIRDRYTYGEIEHYPWVQFELFSKTWSIQVCTGWVVDPELGHWEEECGEVWGR